MERISKTWRHPAWSLIAWAVTLAWAAGGCTSFFPSDGSSTKSRWEAYAAAMEDYEKIIPFKTTAQDLKELGYDPQSSPNLKLLNFLDVQQRFLMNPSIRKEDLPPAVQQCLRAMEFCHAYELDLSISSSKRYGNLALDMSGFRRKTRETGWNFKALIVMDNGLVVYKLSSGNPNLEKLIDAKRPLGPLQDIESVLTGVPGRF